MKLCLLILTSLFILGKSYSQTWKHPYPFTAENYEAYEMKQYKGYPTQNRSDLTIIKTDSSQNSVKLYNTPQN
ncbi:MAG: hypothetical protein ACI9EQ_001371 [Bacteroidia bacterium]|jgi:hypothetical protein